MRMILTPVARHRHEASVLRSCYDAPGSMCCSTAAIVNAYREGLGGQGIQPMRIPSMGDETVSAGNGLQILCENFSITLMSV